MGEEAVLTDSDGMRLLTTEEVAELLGWKPITVRNYAAAGRRARGRRGRDRDYAAAATFPAHKRRVRRAFTKGNGVRGEVLTPVWRLDAIVAYAAARKIPLAGGTEVNGE